MTTYLRPTAPIASDVLLTPNPAEAMALAQRLIEGPLMANHSHGLWGYSGPTPRGAQLTIQSTGIGGPSAAAVLFDLAAHGVRRAINLGYARPLVAGVAPHARILVSAALRGDGASRALGDAPSAVPDPELTGSLRAALGARVREGAVLSRDLHEPPANGSAGHEGAREALVGDLETAALLAAGERAGVAVAGALISLNGDAEAAREHLLELGEACLGAFGPTG
ncbi:MAG TPA: hypothetical protein VHF58_03500 [Solirubrobacterales bacterium]|nr:hypothetical protein [Solirubrobacterales bacterium]